MSSCIHNFRREVPMPRQRPTSVLVIAILQFIFGGLGICGGLYQLSGAADMLQNAVAPQAGQQQGPVSGDIQAFMEKKVPNYAIYAKAEAALGLLLSIIMIAGGVGLVRVEAWGRLLTIVYAFVSIVLKIAGLAYGIAFIFPIMSEFTEELKRQPNLPPGTAEGAQIGLMIGIVFAFGTIVYPIIVLIIMFRPNVVAAFRGEMVQPAFQDYDDRYPQGRVAPPPDERFTGGDR